MWRALGLMSGTSLDGVDVCLAVFDEPEGKLRGRIEAFATYPFDPGLRELVISQLDPATSRIDAICALNSRLGHWFADAALRLLESAGVSPDQVDVIGSHGQTLFHSPEATPPSTLQLGDGSIIAVRTGITTVSDFRPADMAAGGQGAPLVPYADRALFGKAGRAIALLNLGGIANLTLLPAGSGSEVLAFDTGPANMVIDRFVERLTEGRQHFDPGGALGRSGRIDPDLLETWLDHPFFRLPPPKSTGREAFGHAWADAAWDAGVAAGMSGVDLIATATALSVHAIAQAIRAWTPPSLRPEQVLYSGGGAHNAFLIALLSEALSPIEVLPIESQGIAGDAKEALAFALFALQAVRGLPNNLPQATGAERALVLGKICPGRSFGGVRQRPPLPEGDAFTETPNPRSLSLDRMAAADIVQLMADEEDTVAAALQAAVAPLASLVEACVAALRNQGRLFYVGAGTSGRLGVLDASECPPTFSTPPEWVQGLIAGGDRALRDAVEGAEDDREAGRKDLEARNLTARDVVIGLAASGRTPYVHGALEYAHDLGARTALLSCNPLTMTLAHVDHPVELLVGPEVLAGSTRLKAGTVTKAALNMITTATMVRLGKVYRNRMVDVHASNAKLIRRAQRMVEELGGVGPARATELLEASHGQVKTALVMARRGGSSQEAREALEAVEGSLWRVLD